MRRVGQFFRKDLGAERVPDDPLEIRATDLDLGWRMATVRWWTPGT